MRHALAFAAVAAASYVVPGQPAAAQTQRPLPYCYVQFDSLGPTGSYQCNFLTMAQCMETASGLGGQCEQNPALTARAQQPIAKSRVR